MLKRLFWSEVIGSALLVVGGLSLVIFMFGTGTPMTRILGKSVAYGATPPAPGTRFSRR